MRSGGGGGGMLSGMRGTHAASVHAPTMDSLTDEHVVGRVYDNTVVMRLLTYLLWSTMVRPLCIPLPIPWWVEKLKAYWPSP